MNNLKPNLVDPILNKKILKTLNPPKEDYWAPTKSTCKNFYQCYIKPNMLLWIFLFIVLLFLLYRYRIIKEKREQVILNPPPAQPEVKNVVTEQYTDLFLDAYNIQKEAMREPPVKKINSRRLENVPKMAYPMYGYNKGGNLIPSASTK